MAHRSTALINTFLVSLVVIPVCQLFHISQSARGSAVGHVFVSPTDPGVFMSMLCYQNGAITRRQVRDDAIRRAVEAGVTLTSMEADDGAEMLKWAEFNELVMRSPPGNNGAIGIYWNQVRISHSLKQGGLRSEYLGLHEGAGGWLGEHSTVAPDG